MELIQLRLEGWARMFNKKTLSNIDLKDKRILVRADYNVPISNQKIEDDYRIRQSIDTLEALIEQNCRIVIMSHLGRPDGKNNHQLSLRPIAKRLGELLKKDVKFVDDCISDEAVSESHSLLAGEILVVENLRFYGEETGDSQQFAKKLARLGDVFVQDAFGVVHREHASTHAITKFLPSVAGLLLENEIRQITRAIRHPKKPAVAIIGGAKIHTKIELIDNLIPIADRLIIGGAMSNTFLASMGYEIGKSLYDKDELEVAKRVTKLCRRHNTQLLLPMLDVAVAKSVSPRARRRIVATDDVKKDDFILDFGDKSIKSVIENIKDAGTIIWNGPLGMFEYKAFAEASNTVASYIAKHKIDSIVGGGDTAELIDNLGLMDEFTHVSTGGGSALELMSGLPLPGVEALLDKDHRR